MNVVEHNAPANLIALLDRMNSEGDEADWMLVCIRREYLRPMTNEAFLLAMKPVLQSIIDVQLFFVGARKCYVAWRGPQKSAYKLLRNFVSTTLILPGMSIDPWALVTLIDREEDGESLKIALRAEGKKQAVDNGDVFQREEEEDDDEEDEALRADSKTSLVITMAQRERFEDLQKQRPYRKQVSILIVEDQIFSQRLLCEIVRGVRTRGGEAPDVDAVQGIQDAWKIFLKKVSDIVFIDLGLIDGSGHALARSIKELDPMTHVIIVTANNYEEELDIARQNNVDGFIAKPYNKKQILDCIDKYMANFKTKSTGRQRGTFG